MPGVLQLFVVKRFSDSLLAARLVLPNTPAELHPLDPVEVHVTIEWRNHLMDHPLYAQQLFVDDGDGQTITQVPPAGFLVGIGLQPGDRLYRIDKAAFETMTVAARKKMVALRLYSRLSEAHVHVLTFARTVDRYAVADFETMIGLHQERTIGN
jgi:hypothetical protein